MTETPDDARPHDLRPAPLDPYPSEQDASRRTTDLGSDRPPALANPARLRLAAVRRG